MLLRIERKAHKQLNIKITKQTPVISSINVVSESLKNFNDVSTRKQKPRKFEEELNICGDLLSLPSSITKENISGKVVLISTKTIEVLKL